MILIHILGLALGIATCLAIALFVGDELSYDRFHENADQIARVTLNAKMGDEIIKESSVMAPVAQTLVDEIPEIVAATRIIEASSQTKVSYNGNTIRKGKMAYVDANFLELFSLPLIKGDPSTALNQPNAVILTKKQAAYYFANENPIGKTIEIKEVGFYTTTEYLDTSGSYVVKGIIDDIPPNSHFHFDLIASMSSNRDAANQSWLSGSYHTYILMAEGIKASELESKLAVITDKYVGAQLEIGLGMTFLEFLESGNKVGLYLQPLTEIHLFSDFSGQFEAGGDIKTVYIFSAIAIFMLLIACFNFMNLSTASASKRVKEIGMRKVLGSQKKHLIFQFLTESFVATFFATIIGVILFILALPYFNQLSGKSFEFQQILHGRIVTGLIFLILFISITAGAYPAFFMSSFRPIQALKNKFTSGNSKGIRSGLVIFQFTISISLIIGTLVVGQQMNYIQNKDIGYDREELIVLRHAGLLGNNLNAFKGELEKDPRILKMTTSAFIPAGPTDNNGATVSSKNHSNQKLRAQVYNIDEAYISTLGMTLVAGRNFSKTFGSEENKIIINETAIKAFGFEGNPINQTLEEVTNFEGTKKILTVVGVVKDFHSRSLHEPIEPLLMKFNPYYGLIVKAKAADTPHLIAAMETQWNAFNTGEIFDYAFLDALYNETYLKEQNMNSILQIFAFLTVFVACLGLFGLVTFTAQQRFREIGIRKVMGSSVPQIVGLLTKDFLKLVVISMVIAFPLGYYFTNKWLQDFTFRIDIAWWIFGLAGIITMLIAFITISYRSIKAALMNPVKSLRTE